jgi:CBS domain-containing protein
MSAMPGPMLDATVEALRRHAPYDRMDRASLEFLASQLSIAYYAKGARVTVPEQGVANRLYIIQRGLVRGEVEGDANATDVVEYAGGDTFPLAAIMAKRPVRHAYIAAEDSFCYEASADVVEALVQRSPEFHAFCTSRVSALLQQSYAVLQAQYAQRSSNQQSLGVTLRELVRREPLRCGPQEPLRAALLAMQKAGIGSIVIVDEAGAPAGIFTERDLLRLAAADALDPGQAIGMCMTPSPHCLPASATAAEAAVLMVQRGIRHVIVVEEGRLTGVVSERDLFALQRTSMRGIVQALDSAAGTADLVQAAADIRALAANLLAQGVAAEQLIELIASLNDRLCSRILALESPRHDIAALKPCWIALGSEGRLEQTFATDQDNALIFDPGPLPIEEARARLVAFARAVNATLDACGFPLCKGDVMAGNPAWCLSGAEWRATFGNWIRNPLPQALLNSNIFYDFSPLWGDAASAHALREWLSQEVKGNDRFLRAMAVNAMDARPPLGLFSDFVTSGTGGERNTIDLKAEGTRPFVDAARILALASGVAQTNTAARLRRGGARLKMPDAEIAAMVEAFHFIQLLRLRHQHQHQNDGMGGDASGATNPNRIDPDTLNELDRRILKEAFRQARKLQRRIALDYQL